MQFHFFEIEVVNTNIFSDSKKRVNFVGSSIREMSLDLYLTFLGAHLDLW